MSNNDLKPAERMRQELDLLNELYSEGLDTLEEYNQIILCLKKEIRDELRRINKTPPDDIFKKL
jgi:hypothetical protein